jgi:hypothetical protein
MMKFGGYVAVAALGMAAGLAPAMAGAAELSSDAKAAIPKNVQQVIVVDYRAMLNSPAAMSLKDRVLPPELKKLETALKTSGLQVDKDADTLAFASFKAGSDNSSKIVGIAQGQFQTQKIMANFAKNKVKPVMVRNNSIYPMGSAGMSVVWVDQTTMIFGSRTAVDDALDARDGMAPSFLQNGEMVNDMAKVDSQAVWSLLDQKGTQTMMKSVLGEASGLADYDTVKDRMKSARYTMDFSNGVKFEMTVVTSDTMTAAMAATLMKGVAIMRKTQGSPLEKTAIDATNIDSNSGTIVVAYSSSDQQFANLLTSPLFQSVVK